MNAAAIASIGIDLGKTVFHLVALDCHAGVIVRKKFSRSQLLAYTANLPWSLIGMEACSGAHFLAAKLREQGHESKTVHSCNRTADYTFPTAITFLARQSTQHIPAD